MDCEEKDELKQAVEDVAPLVEAMLWLGTEEGRKAAVMQGVRAVAAVHNRARELVEKSPYWARRFGETPDVDVPIEQVDDELRALGVDPKKVEADGRDIGHMIRMMNAIRKALAQNIVRAAAEDVRLGSFASALAKLERVDTK